MRSDDMLFIELTGPETALVANGLNEWLGPARPTQEFAVAMGFLDCDDLWATAARLRNRVQAGESLSRLDWCRTLLAVEVVLVSNLVGSGFDWEFTTGIDDVDAFLTLRRLQAKLTSELMPLMGSELGSYPAEFGSTDAPPLPG